MKAKLEIPERLRILNDESLLGCDLKDFDKNELIWVLENEEECYIYVISELCESIQANDGILLDRTYSPFSKPNEEKIIALPEIKKQISITHNENKVKNSEITQSIKLNEIAKIFIAATGLLHPNERGYDSNGYRIGSTCLYWIESELENSSVTEFKVTRCDMLTDNIEKTAKISEIIAHTKAGSCGHQAGMFLWKFLYDLNEKFISNDKETRGFIKNKWLRSSLINLFSVDEVLVELTSITHNIRINTKLEPEAISYLMDVIQIMEHHLNSLQNPSIYASFINEQNYNLVYKDQNNDEITRHIERKISPIKNFEAKHENSKISSFIRMTVLGGFASILGCSIFALALVCLSGPLLSTVLVGAAITAVGIGFFAKGIQGLSQTKNKNQNQNLFSRIL
ncbi:MAG: hypothetical protein Q8M40_02175 [Legionella sp.]|nr:hypothetical protein [Legionella sp.]